MGSKRDKSGQNAPPKPHARRRHAIPPTIAAELVMGDSYATIARRHKADEHLVGKWAKLPETVAEVARLNQELREATAQRVIGGHKLALDVLAEIATSRAPKQVRAKAAHALGALTAPKGPVQLDVNLGGRLDLSGSDDDLKARIAALAADRE